HLVDPDFVLNDNCSLRTLTCQDREGFAIYRRSATLILIEAVHQLFPGKQLSIGQSLSNGYYFDLDPGRELDQADISAIQETISEIIRQDRHFTKQYLHYQEARQYFQEEGLLDKVSLLEFHRSPEVCLIGCGEVLEFYNGPVAPTTGRITILAVEPYGRGFILRFPTWEEPESMPPMRKEEKLFSIYLESRKWNKILSVENVGQLNKLCVTGKVRNLIIIAEAFHAKKIGAIADEIKNRADSLKLIMIAGPSASGKTTFAKRLSIQLRINGLDPVILSMDNYFINREETPLDSNGERDFESLSALDLELFNHHLQELIGGNLIESPRFDFKTGNRKMISTPIQLTPGKVLLIEGIHGLNNMVSTAIPSKYKFLVYISAFTQLQVDAHTRIFTSDTRLLRRIVRDRIFRGWSALDTIRRWPSVRRGERKNIFPFQENADVFFNSALVYEYTVLKNYAELALLDTTPDQPEYPEVERLLQFLSWFAPISEKNVPSTSILREFIGDSFFNY
ncbi:MAG: nucleoside kinase, partial [Candidatus Auribacterota bacterium]|nr:nucleoside kinase [Candidatus Auribacterota bacterium]